MAEVAVKKRGRPKKVVGATEDERVIVRVLEAAAAAENTPTSVTKGIATAVAGKSKSKAASTTTSTAAKKATTATATAAKTKESTTIPAESKKATSTTTTATTTRKRVAKNSTSRPADTDTTKSIATPAKTESRGENATTAQIDSEEPIVTTSAKHLPVAEAKTSAAESKKLPVQEDASVLVSAPRSTPKATTTTSTVLKSKKTTATSAAKGKDALPQRVQVNGKSEDEVRLRLSTILQQAQAFSKHSDDLHRSLLELVSEREGGLLSNSKAATITVEPVAATSVSNELKHEQERTQAQENQTPAVTIAIASNGNQSEEQTQLEIELKDVQAQQVPTSVPVSAAAPPQTETPPTPSLVSVSQSPEAIEIVVDSVTLTDADSYPTEIKAESLPEEHNGVETKATHPVATAPTIYISSASMPLPTPQSWWSRPRYVLPASTVTALAARGINTNTTQQQQGRQAVGSGSGGDSVSGRGGGVSLPSHGPKPIPPKRPSEIPLDKLKKDPKYRELSRRWTTIMVALPVAIVSSYVLWERCEYPPLYLCVGVQLPRCFPMPLFLLLLYQLVKLVCVIADGVARVDQEQQAYRKAKEAKDRLGLEADRSS